MPVIKGIQKTTFVDYPGKIACTIWTAGCNFRCVFCHNATLVDEKQSVSIPAIPEEEILEYLGRRTHQLDGVCISGGEPTLHKDLPDFIRKVKALGYSVKLDTNGTNPEMLKQLLAEKLLDYIAMDIKGPINIYPLIVNTEVNQDHILESIEIIKSSGIKYEFRTTIMPDFHSEKDVAAVGCMLHGADIFFLQQFRSSEGVLNEKYQKAESYSDSALLDLSKKFSPYVKNVKVRGIA